MWVELIMTPSDLVFLTAIYVFIGPINYCLKTINIHNLLLFNFDCNKPSGIAGNCTATCTPADL